MATAEINFGLAKQITQGSVVEIFYDPNGKWYPAKVLQVNSSEGQLFVHYKGWKARFDEWIPVDGSVRLPGAQTEPKSANQETAPLTSNSSSSVSSDFIDVSKLSLKKARTNLKVKRSSKEPKVDKSVAKVYKSGEMLLGAWKDGYQYVCFIQSASDNGTYNVKFYDGSRATLAESKLSPVTEVALKEYEQWKWEEEQIKEYVKKTGKRVKTYAELAQVLNLGPASSITSMSSAQKSEAGEFVNTSLGDVSVSLNVSKDSEDDKYICEEPNCGKKFRKLTLLLHHTKHYHKHSSLVDDSISKSCSADVLAGRLKEERSVGEIAVKKKERHHKLDASKEKNRLALSSLTPKKNRKNFASESFSVERKRSSLSNVSDVVNESAADHSWANEKETGNTAEDEIEVFVVEGQGDSTPNKTETSKEKEIDEDSKLVLAEKTSDSFVSGTETGSDVLEQLRFSSKSKKLNASDGKTSLKPKITLTASAGKFYCTLCGGAFSSKKYYDKHLSIHGLTPDNVNKKSKVSEKRAEVTNTETRSPSFSKSVKPIVQDLAKSFICPVCSQKFVTFDSLRNHQKVRLHQVKDPEPDVHQEVAEIATEESVAKSDFDVSFLVEPLPKMEFKKTVNLNSKEVKLKRKKTLLENLKRPKLAKMKKQRLHIGSTHQKSQESRKVSDAADESADSKEPSFTPVFLDPPSSADDQSSLTQESTESKQDTAINRSRPLQCPHAGCGQSFRKEAFLNLHVKHFHSSKKKQSSDALKAVSFKNNVSKSKASIGGNRRKTKASPKSRTSQVLKSSTSGLKLKTPVKQNYSDIINESVSTTDLHTSPLSSDNDGETDVSFSVKSVRDSPSTVGIKKIFAVRSRRDDDESPDKERQRATIDESESEGSAESDGWSGEVIKCVCEDSDFFGTMVQCNFCDCWLHGECLNVTDATLPDTYECPYCEARKRVRKSERFADWYSLTSHQEPLGPCAKDGRFYKATAPLVVATDQFAQDLFHLQDMIGTLETLSRIMQNPGHPDYPQLVLRFQHILHTFNSDESNLEHSHLDPSVVRLLMELRNSAPNAASPNEDFVSPVVTPSKALNGSALVPFESETPDNKTGQTVVSESGTTSEETNEMSDSQNGAGAEIEDIDLDSSLEIDEENDASNEAMDQEKSSPINTWISPQKLTIPSSVPDTSGVENVHQITNQELDLDQSLSLSSYKSNIELLYSMHKYEEFDPSQLTSTQLEKELSTGQSKSAENNESTGQSESIAQNSKQLDGVSIDSNEMQRTLGDQPIGCNKDESNGSMLAEGQKQKKEKKMKFDPAKPPKNILEMINRLIFQLETRMGHLEQLFDNMQTKYEQTVEQLLSGSDVENLDEKASPSVFLSAYNISPKKMTKRELKEISNHLYLLDRVSFTQSS